MEEIIYRLLGNSEEVVITEDIQIDIMELLEENE